MPQINDDVRNNRLQKACEWLISNAESHTWSDKDLVLASAIGYFVPSSFRSATSANINDDRIIELMKAQGYKPRAKKAHESSDEEANVVIPILSVVQRKYKKKKTSITDDMSHDEMLTTITNLSSMLTTLVKQVNKLQTKLEPNVNIN
jgi:hypothetical protein